MGTEVDGKSLYFAGNFAVNLKWPWKNEVFKKKSKKARGQPILVLEVGMARGRLPTLY